jgi:hypothetical protein
MAHTHSTHPKPGSHGAVTSSVEEDHVNLRGVFGFGIGLAVVTIIVHLAMVLMFRIEVNAIDAANPPRVFPLAIPQDERLPPEPRLQTNPKQELIDMRAAEEEILTGYRWVDRNNNIVRIPVADAMKLTLQRGLPSRQPAPAAAAPTQATQATQEKSK